MADSDVKDTPGRAPTDEERAEARKKLHEKLDGEKRSIVLAGTCGAGKSTLVNTIVLRKACEEARGAKPWTDRAKRKFIPIELGTRGMAVVEVYDTPGFNGEKKNDAMAEQQLRSINNPDLLLLCFSLDSDGGRYMPMKIGPVLKKAKEVFGEEFLKSNAAIMLTRGNLVPVENAASFKTPVDGWSEAHHSYCQGEHLPADLPILVSGKVLFNDKGEMVDLATVGCEKQWLKTMWNGICKKTEPSLTSMMYEFCRQAYDKCSNKEIKDCFPELSVEVVGKIVLFSAAVAVVGAVGGGALFAFTAANLATSALAGGAASGATAASGGIWAWFRGSKQETKEK